jgi:formate hydrogenlyase subunit 6/NADH:ubiquinone oxidoreductase subunit I
MSIISDVIQSTKAILSGMKTTLSQIPKEKWTVQYPDEPITVQPRYRGQHLLHVDEMGKESATR